MKFIAKKDFLNVPALGIVLNEKTPGFVNANHVHRGHRFSIGSDDVFKKCTDSERKIITALISSESVVVDNQANTEAVAKIDAEMKTKAARKASAAQSAAP
jgi:hypothetical protein